MNVNVNDLVDEALKMPSNTTRFTGTVEGYDAVRTTIFVLTEDGRKFLAFYDPNNPLQSGDQISFRVSGLRAVDVRKEIPAG